MAEHLTPERVAEIGNRADRRMEKCRRRGQASLADVECTKNEVHELAEEIDRLRAELEQVSSEIARFGIHGAAVPAAKALVKRADELVTADAALKRERDEHRAAAEKAEAKLRKIEYGCETPESHNYGCPCEPKGGAR